MPLARTWRRMTGRMSGLTLLVPAIVVIALAATTLGGGLRGLGGLDQIVAGPEISPAPLGDDARNGRERPTASAGDLPTLPSATPPAGTPANGGSSGTGATGGGTAAPGAGSAPSGSNRRPGGGGGPAPAPGAGTGGTAAASAPAATAPAPAGPVRDVGTAGAEAVGQVAPAPLGQAGKDAVNSVVDIVAPAPKP